MIKFDLILLFLMVSRNFNCSIMIELVSRSNNTNSRTKTIKCWNKFFFSTSWNRIPIDLYTSGRLWITKQVQFLETSQIICQCSKVIWLRISWNNLYWLKSACKIKKTLSRPFLQYSLQTFTYTNVSIILPCTFHSAFSTNNIQVYNNHSYAFYEVFMKESSQRKHEKGGSFEDVIWKLF